MAKWFYAQGVTIALNLMNSSNYDAQTNVAQIEPGGRWRDVYANLETYGVTAAGGRDGNVGVGGFLFGGGISYYQAQIGFSRDTIVNYEVVLGNGTIVNANRTANADLWKVLKGGGNNFGIVTRFDVEAIPAVKLYYDMRVMSTSYSNAVIDGVTGFGNLNSSQADNAIIAYSATISQLVRT
jgi:FAD/FMN-containing dehydrogenase